MTSGEVLNDKDQRTRWYKTVACANETNKSRISYLSEELIFYILILLPADVLYNSMRYVCRQWYNIIHDPLVVTEHLLHSTSGMFIMCDAPQNTVHFVELGKMRATVTAVRWPFPRMVLATCDGLVLFGDRRPKIMHVANPLTMQKLTFPRFKCSWGGSHFSLACARSTGKYKVVCTYPLKGWKVFNCVIVTLGEDYAWKPIDCTKLSDPCRKIFAFAPLSKGRYLYWASNCYRYVVALDVESEIFYEFPSPTTGISVFYVKTAKSLSCIDQLSSGTWLDVWVLSSPMSGEWRKLYKIDFDIQKRGWSSRPFDVGYFRPIVWVNNDEVVVFRVFRQGPYFAHNVKTSETFTFGNCTTKDRLFFWGYFAYSLVSFTPSQQISP